MKPTHLLLVLFLPLSAYAQKPVFRSLTERDGLSHHDTRALCRDRSGALWIGTAQGLDRYDGSSIINFGTADGLPSPTVNDVEAGMDGRLWLATTQGLARLDPITWRIETWHVTGGPDPKVSDRLKRLAVLADGNLLCAAEDGLWRFRYTDSTWTKLPDIGGLPLRLVGSVMMPDSNGTGAWVSIATLGLVYYRLQGDELFHPGNNPGQHPLLEGLGVGAACKDAAGNWWLAPHGGRDLLFFRRAGRHVQRWSGYSGMDRSPFAVCMVLACDRSGRLWSGVNTHPARVMDPQDSSVISLTHDARDPSTLAAHSLNDWYQDERGLIWIATSGGVSVHDPSGFQCTSISPGRHFERYSDMFVTGVHEARDGILWMGTRGGSVSYDPRSEAYTLHAIPDGNNTVDQVVYLTAMDEDLVMATMDGLWKLNTGTHQFERFELPNTEGIDPRRDPILWIERDSKGRIWLYGWMIGLYRYDPATHESFFFPHGPKYDEVTKEGRHVPGRAARLGEEVVRKNGVGQLHCMLEASDGHVWFGHDSEGLLRFDPESGTFRVFTPPSSDRSGSVTAIAEGPGGEIWFIAYNDGLYRFDPVAGSFKRYGREHGLPAEAGWAIVPDRGGRLWLGTRKGLACFDPKLERAHPVHYDNGLEFNEPGRPALRLPDGDILMANMYSVMRFSPDDYQWPSAPPTPVIHALTVQGQRIPIHGTGPITLTHEQDAITFHGASFDLPGRITRYAARRAGDSAWVESRSGEMFFSSLKPGDYHFEYRVMAEPGNWSVPAQVHFIIQPPWWKQLWARSVLALLLGGLIVLIFRIRLKRVRERERAKETQARTVNELKLQALRAQMDPHFIFNSLNSIDSYILANEPERASHYLGRFAKLIRLILQHSDSVNLPLEREVEMLRYYLELEALRFKTPFLFEVKVDPLLEGEPIELPTMLVQPFVENAIWHGLRHKEGQGHVTVEFRHHVDGLECVVEDDGIGREASKLINQERSGIHRSMGMRVSAGRLRILQEVSDRTARITIHDLRDRQGQAIGTRVVILMPMGAGPADGDGMEDGMVSPEPAKDHTAKQG